MSWDYNAITITNKSGDEVEATLFETIGCIEDTPIMLKLPEAWLEFTRVSNSDLYMSFSGNDHGYAIIYENEVIAFATFSTNKGPNVWITMGWVDKDWRGLNLYNHLWEAIKAWSVQNDIHAIMGSTGVNNFAMQRAMEKEDRIKTGILYKYDVIGKELGVDMNYPVGE